MAYMSKTKRRRVMRKRVLGFSITALVIVAIFTMIWLAGPGRVLATVEGKPIRSSTMEGAYLYILYNSYGSFPNFTTVGMTKDEISEMEDSILVEKNYYLDSILVPLEVLKQHFAAQGKAFPTEEAQAVIDETIDSIFLTPATERLFSQNGVKKEHVIVYLEYVAAMEMYTKELLETNPITDEEALDYYNENISSFTTPASFQASHILLIDAEHTPERREEIEAILERIHEGEDFAELAMEYSEDSSAENGGDLGTFYTGYMVEPFEKACIALAPGEVSDIVETDFGYHIIKMADKTEEVVASFEDSRETIDSYMEYPRVSDALDILVESANIVYKTLVNPTTGKPPTSVDELNEARGIVPEDESEVIDDSDIFVE